MNRTMDRIETEHTTKLGLSVVLRPEANTLIVRWLKESDPDTLKTAYHYVLTLAQQHRCYNWLVDIRRRNVLSPVVAKWVVSEFVHEVSKVCAKPVVKICYVASPTRMVKDAIAVFPSEREVKTRHGKVKILTVITENDANDWLYASHH